MSKPDNPFSIHNCSENATITFAVDDVPGNPHQGNWIAQLLKGSPLRTLLENQDTYQNKAAK